MTNRPHRGRSAGRPGPSRQARDWTPAVRGGTPGVPAATEPEVRRWPHPIAGDLPEQPPEPALHYIRCALSYQNQLLAEIKTLLEKLAVPEEKDQGS